MNRHQKNLDSYGRSIDLGEIDLDNLEEYPPPQKPRRARRLFGFVFFLLLIIVAILGGLYWYVHLTPLKSTATGRINLLVLGIDDTANLADTVMLVSIDADAKPEPQVAVVSIPRDLYVEVPGFDTTKINSAYSYGENTGSEGSEVMKSTIESTFDIPIHYYLSVNFSGFEAAVDAIGGVTVEVPETIEDPFYPNEVGGYAPFYLVAGTTKMDGELALRYARSRQTTSDFDRAARQQQIALAFQQEVVNSGTLLNRQRIDLLRRIADEHIKTNLSLREITKLAELTRSVGGKNVTQHVLSNKPESYLENTTAYGGYGLVPRAGDFTEINDYIKNIFTRSATDSELSAPTQ